MNKGLKGLERHEGEYWQNFHFWLNYPFKEHLHPFSEGKFWTSKLKNTELYERGVAWTLQFHFLYTILRVERETIASVQTIFSALWIQGKFIMLEILRNIHKVKCQGE